MTSKEIVQAYFTHMEEHGHKQVPNVSVIPNNDPTLLFVNSGMFPLVPYLSGEEHPLGKRLYNVQRSIRFFEDIDNVGKTIRHTTAFHMLGNWSLGDYFKKEQLSMLYAFYVKKLGLDIHRLYATVFAGDESAPKDTESIAILQDIFSSYGISAQVGNRIFTHGKEDNWWQRGDTPGELGGPDSEVFYYLGDGDASGKDPADYQDEFLEIGNSVFMQYRKTTDLRWEEMQQKNVDFGGGLERIALVVQGKKDIFETDNFAPIIQTVEFISKRKYGENETTRKAMRVLADHMRSASILAMDGVIPSNKDQGYILRRLLRRMVRYAQNLGITSQISPVLFDSVLSVPVIDWLYPEMKKQRDHIMQLFAQEETKFRRTLQVAEKRIRQLDFSKYPTEHELAQVAFDIFQSQGYPPEMFIEFLQESGKNINKTEFQKIYRSIFAKHQQQSRTGAEHKFKGGLADHNEQTIKYHTATHLIHQALSRILGESVRQEGSNITAQRLRFDFASTQKPTPEVVEHVSKKVNEIIAQALPVSYAILPKQEALKLGAKSFFKEKYPDQVKVYFIGGDVNHPLDSYSKEFCGGPHVKNTKEIGHISIDKVESIGNNMYRLYAR